jgi:hypothetical protein
MSATHPIPTPEQEARAKWDLLLLDIEQRTEQLRQLKATPTRIVVLQLAMSAATAAVVFVGGVGGGTVWLLHAMGYLP